MAGFTDAVGPGPGPDRQARREVAGHRQDHLHRRAARADRPGRAGRRHGQGGRLARPAGRGADDVGHPDPDLRAAGGATAPAPAPARRSGSRRLEEITKVLFVVPAALAIVALFGYPVVKNVVDELPGLRPEDVLHRQGALRRAGELRRPWSATTSSPRPSSTPRCSRSARSSASSSSGCCSRCSSTELPAARRPARAVPAALAAAADRRQCRVAGDPRAGQRHPQRHAGEPRGHRRAGPVADLARRSRWSRSSW